MTTEQADRPPPRPTTPTIAGALVRRRVRRAAAGGRGARGRRPVARGHDRPDRARRRAPAPLRAAPQRGGAPGQAARQPARRRPRGPRHRRRRGRRRLIRPRGARALGVRGRDVVVEPEHVVRVVPPLHRARGASSARRRTPPGPAPPARRPGRSCRSPPRCTTTAGASRRSVAPRRCSPRRPPGPPRSRARTRSSAPRAGRTPRRPPARAGPGP